MEASLGNALARAAVAWAVLAVKEKDASLPDRLLRVSPLISFFQALLKLQKKTTVSPNVKKRRPPDELFESFLTHSVSKTSISSLSPFKTPKALSLDLNRTYRSQSTYRMETDRVNRLTHYCESLERKAKWATLRETKEAERKRLLQERAKVIQEQFVLNRSFQDQLVSKQRLQRLTEQQDKDESRTTTREAKLRLRREEAKRTQDDLHRSVSGYSVRSAQSGAVFEGDYGGDQEAGPGGEAPGDEGVPASTEAKHGGAEDRA